MGSPHRPLFTQPLPTHHSHATGLLDSAALRARACLHSRLRESQQLQIHSPAVSMTKYISAPSRFSHQPSSVCPIVYSWLTIPALVTAEILSLSGPSQTATPLFSLTPSPPVVIMFILSPPIPGCGANAAVVPTLRPPPFLGPFLAELPSL